MENNHDLLNPLGNSPAALVEDKLTALALRQLSGEMSGYPYIKVVFDSELAKVHFINDHVYKFHADYIAERILDVPKEEVRAKIDEFNESVYLKDERRFYVGILALHKTPKRKFFTLETVEVDTMSSAMLQMFFLSVKDRITLDHPLYLKPANHLQEKFIAEIDPIIVPRIFNHELVASQSYIPLNVGQTKGRLRAFSSQEQYKKERDSIEWYDIVVMDRVPDSIPRISGIINSSHTTPLSHTNVLAHGWKIPNAVQIDVLNDIEQMGLNGKWVNYKVSQSSQQVFLKELKGKTKIPKKPSWKTNHIILEHPDIETHEVTNLYNLRMNDRHRYGTKSANIGELTHVIEHGSNRFDGFYRIERPPRANLLPYLQKILKANPGDDLNKMAHEWLQQYVVIPRGVAIPFSLQQEFLETYPKIQQQIGKLKMALELGVKEINHICINLQKMIRQAPMTVRMQQILHSTIDQHLKDVNTIVVRSSSNAEDLEGFSAAGIYESKNHVTTRELAFQSIKEVWASLVSGRSVHLRQQVGISLDDTYMGVILQEEIQANFGGVMVTTNPMNPTGDIRNVYINASTNSVMNVVDGQELPYQYLYNTMEGGGRTLTLGSYKEDLPQENKDILQKLAIIGRFLQSHFSPDYTFSAPVDIEWASDGNKIYILQLRPYTSS